MHNKKAAFIFYFPCDFLFWHHCSVCSGSYPYFGSKRLGRGRHRQNKRKQHGLAFMVSARMPEKLFYLIFIIILTCAIITIKMKIQKRLTLCFVCDNIYSCRNTLMQYGSLFVKWIVGYGILIIHPYLSNCILFVGGDKRWNADCVGAFNILRLYFQTNGIEKQMDPLKIADPYVIKVAV